METKIKVTSLTHDELVDFLSTALYGCENFGVSVAWDSKHLYKKCKEDMGKAFCWEDGLAEVLLGGGKLDVTDYYAEEDPDTFVVTDTAVSCDEDGNVLHRIDYKNVLNGFSTPEGYKYAEELFDGDGDFFTAWNLLQIIIFGEVIYG